MCLKCERANRRFQTKEGPSSFLCDCEIFRNLQIIFLGISTHQASHNPRWTRKPQKILGWKPAPFSWAFGRWHRAGCGCWTPPGYAFGRSRCLQLICSLNEDKTVDGKLTNFLGQDVRSIVDSQAIKRAAENIKEVMRQQHNSFFYVHVSRFLVYFNVYECNTFL